MYTTTSFAEKAFLNPYYFHYLYPSECKEMRINNPSESIIDTLDSLESNPFTSESKGFGHQALKPLRLVARMAYSVFVSVLIAPTGVVYHSGIAIKNLASYSFKKIFTNSQTFPENLEIAKKHASSLYTDAAVAFIGTVVAISCISIPLFFAYPPLLASVYRAVGSFGFQVLAGLVPFFAFTSPVSLGGYNPEFMIPRYIADWETHIGMYISLKLWNDLGLVGPDGNLLPFNSSDNLRFTKAPERAFKNNENEEISKTLLKLSEFIIYAECELIQHVREANYLAERHNLEKTPFQYPFDGNQIAKKFQKQFQHPQISIEEQKLIESLKMTERKIQVLRGILKEVCERAKTFGGENDPTTHFNPSLLEEEDYNKFFEGGFDESIDQSGNNWSTLILGLNQIYPVNPTEVAFDPAASTYNKFKYKVGVAKTLALQNKEFPLHELLFLNEEYTKEELNKQYRHLSLRVHPDKNENSLESQELFQALGNAKAILDENHNSR